MRWIAAALALALGLWLWSVLGIAASSSGPNGLNFGVDFSHTYAASLIVGDRGNPYNADLLSRMQHQALAAEHLPIQAHSAIVRVGSSPFFLWFFRPLNALPYQTAAAVWMLASILLTLLGMIAILRYLGWKHALLPSLMFLAAPPTVLGIFYGNTITLVFAGVACALPLLRRYPVLAGVLLSMVMLKLPAALPFAVLVTLFLAPRKQKVIAGFVAAYAVRQIAGMVLLGAQYEWWEFGGYLDFTHSIQLQPNLTSLSGLYAHWLPAGPKIGLETLTLAGACVVTAIVWWRVRGRPAGPQPAAGWLWLIWLVATPYAHFVDEMLLIIPILILVGPDGANLARALPLTVVGLVMSSVFFFSWTPFDAQLLWLPLAAAASCYAAAGSRPALPCHAAGKSIDFTASPSIP